MFRLLLICMLLSSCSFNKVDKRNFRQGRWKMYYDDEKKQLMWKGRYKDHHQVGHWKYYTSRGTIYLDERYQKDKRIKTRYYDYEGRKHLEGYATYVESLDTAYYRWEGDWLKYDTTGTLVEVSYYKFGKFAWYKPLNSVKK
jgi:antitoxin component YwqK of YwqJK toxin-antitoxin module